MLMLRTVVPSSIIQLPVRIKHPRSIYDDWGLESSLQARRSTQLESLSCNEPGGIFCCLPVLFRLHAQKQSGHGCFACIDVAQDAHQTAMRYDAAHSVQGTYAVQVHTQHLQHSQCNAIKKTLARGRFAGKTLSAGQLRVQSKLPVDVACRLRCWWPAPVYSLQPLQDTRQERQSW